MMSEEESATLVESMRSHGFDSAHPIVLFEGKILDGRNRHRAAIAAGLVPKTIDWIGADPWDYVWRENAVRRHLEASQKAAIAVEFVRGSEAWQTERERAKEEANRKRAEASSVAMRGNENAAKVKTGHLSSDKRPVSAMVRVDPTADPQVAAGLSREHFGSDATRKPAPNSTHAHNRIAAMAGVSPATAARVLSVQAKSPEQFERVKLGELSASKALGEVKLQAKRELAEEIRANPVVTPDGRYQVIVSDPPWKYDARAEDTTHRGKNLYPEMTVPEICALPVGKLAQPDCVLWLWTTNAFMRGAYECLDAWGFQEKTILTWDKELLGLGDWLRNVTEHCILAVRGKPIVSLTNQTTMIRERRREHSRKPEAFYAMVDALCPGSKLEMFSRTPRLGWSTWGAETGKFDVV